MTTYTARVYFTVLEFDARDTQEAEARVNQLIDQLGNTTTELQWDDLDWTLTEEKEN
jgi:hypothetical protein